MPKVGRGKRTALLLVFAKQRDRSLLRVSLSRPGRGWISDLDGYGMMSKVWLDRADRIAQMEGGGALEPEASMQIRPSRVRVHLVFLRGCVCVSLFASLLPWLSISSVTQSLSHSVSQPVSSGSPCLCALGFDESEGGTGKQGGERARKKKLNKRHLPAADGSSSTAAERRTGDRTGGTHDFDRPRRNPVALRLVREVSQHEGEGGAGAEQRKGTGRH